jgi:hypothetical protein
MLLFGSDAIERTFHVKFAALFYREGRFECSRNVWNTATVGCCRDFETVEPRKIRIVARRLVLICTANNNILRASPPG